MCAAESFPTILRARLQKPISADAKPAASALNQIQGQLLRTIDVAVRSRLVGQLEHIEENDVTPLSRGRALFNSRGTPRYCVSSALVAFDEALIEYAMDDPASQCLVIMNASVAH